MKIVSIDRRDLYVAINDGLKSQQTDFGVKKFYIKYKKWPRFKQET